MGSKIATLGKFLTGKGFNITVKDLKIGELSRCKFPENDFNIWVDLVGFEQKNYHLVYSNSSDSLCREDYYPRVSLSSQDVPRAEFDKMLEYITISNQGKEIPRRLTEEDGINKRISALVHEDRFPFTFQNISNILTIYQQRFQSVSIPVSYFYSVSKRNIFHPGFSRSKISFN